MTVKKKTTKVKKATPKFKPYAPRRGVAVYSTRNVLGSKIPVKNLEAFGCTKMYALANYIESNGLLQYLLEKLLEEPGFEEEMLKHLDIKLEENVTINLSRSPRKKKVKNDWFF